MTYGGANVGRWSSSKVGIITPSKLDDIEHAIEKAAAVALVKVRDDEIIVTMPGTTYAVTYYKPANSSQLLARHIAESDDKRTSMSLSEFLTLAWNSLTKGREN